MSDIQTAKYSDIPVTDVLLIGKFLDAHRTLQNEIAALRAKIEELTAPRMLAVGEKRGRGRPRIYPANETQEERKQRHCEYSQRKRDEKRAERFAATRRGNEGATFDEPHI